MIASTLRIEFEVAIYHVMAQGNGRAGICLSDADGELSQKNRLILTPSIYDMLINGSATYEAAEFKFPGTRALDVFWTRENHMSAMAMTPCGRNRPIQSINPKLRDSMGRKI